MRWSCKGIRSAACPRHRWWRFEAHNAMPWGCLPSATAQRCTGGGGLSGTADCQALHLLWSVGARFRDGIGAAVQRVWRRRRGAVQCSARGARVPCNDFVAVPGTSSKSQSALGGNGCSGARAVGSASGNPHRPPCRCGTRCRDVLEIGPRTGASEQGSCRQPTMCQSPVPGHTARAPVQALPLGIQRHNG